MFGGNNLSELLNMSEYALETLDKDNECGSYF